MADMKDGNPEAGGTEEKAAAGDENLEDLWGDALKEQSTTEVKNWGPDHIEKKKVSPDADSGEGTGAPAGVAEGASKGASPTTATAFSGGVSGAGAADEGNAGGGERDDRGKVKSLSGRLKLINVPTTPVEKIVDEVKVGDEALNKLTIQNIDFILDVPLKVTVELGRATILVKDLLQLGQGSVVELDKLAGEPLEVKVNGQLVARGEVVVVNEKFGVRLTDIVNPMQRIESLRSKTAQ